MALLYSNYHWDHIVIIIKEGPELYWADLIDFQSNELNVMILKNDYSQGRIRHFVQVHKQSFKSNIM